MKQAAMILQDVMYLMSRTDDAREERVFFKIQSIGTRFISVFQRAFPDIPFIFVYREPVQVMMSQLAMGPKRANCVRPRVLPHPVPILEEVIAKRGKSSVRDLTDEEYCAAHLATITESAVTGISHSNGKGMSVNYEDLPHILYETVFPKHFGMSVDQTEIDNIVKICSIYSKGTAGQHQEYQPDSEEKERLASRAIKRASQLFLQESYEQLQTLRKKE
jgi:hypothetical protein